MAVLRLAVNPTETFIKIDELYSPRVLKTRAVDNVISRVSRILDIYKSNRDRKSVVMCSISLHFTLSRSVLSC